jgi:DNA-binding NarL/FixJ family response regulator
MCIVILAAQAGLAMEVKAHLDRQWLGPTEIVSLEDPAAAFIAAKACRPSMFLWVGVRLEPAALALGASVAGDAVTRRIPLVVALEHADEAERIAVLDAGADSVIVPGTMDAIERRVRRVRRYPPVYQGFQGDGLSFNDRRPEVRVHGTPVVLTDRENALLRALVHRRNGTVTRRQLEQDLWGRARSRTLDVHISRLRKKLGPLGHRIETVTKVGYRYVEPS